MEEWTDAAKRHDPPATAGAPDRAAAFSRLAEGRLDHAYGLARLILGDPTEAEDATHDAFVAAWRGYGGLRDPDRFDRWFDRILVNACRRRLNARRRGPVVDISGLVEIPDRAPQPHDLVADRAEMERAFGALSQDPRAVLALRYYADLPVDEIAARLGLRPGTVKSRIHLALRALGGLVQLGRRENER